MGQEKPVLMFDVYGVHQGSKVHQQDFGSFSPAQITKAAANTGYIILP